MARYLDPVNMKEITLLLFLYSCHTVESQGGSSIDNVTVSLADFITNGSQIVNLTCTATHSYPDPTYTWSGINCENVDTENTCNQSRKNDETNQICTVPDENTCTFKPDPVKDQFKAVTCTVSQRLGPNTTQAAKTVHLQLFHPPLVKPVIWPNPTEHVLQPGDRVTCTVSGGRPRVSSVRFYCVDPFLPDEDDQTSLTTVMISSSVKVIANSTDITTNNLTCYCSAVWTLNPLYYQLISMAVFRVAPYSYNPSGVLAGVFALLFFAVVIAVVGAIRKRLNKHRGASNRIAEGGRDEEASFEDTGTVSGQGNDPPAEDTCSSTPPTVNPASTEHLTASSDTGSVQMEIHPPMETVCRRQSEPSLGATQEECGSDADVYSTIAKKAHPLKKAARCTRNSEPSHRDTKEDGSDVVYSNIAKKAHPLKKAARCTRNSEPSHRDTKEDGSDAVYSNVAKKAHPLKKVARCTRNSEPSHRDTKEDGSDVVYSNVAKKAHPLKKAARCKRHSEPLLGATKEDHGTDVVYINVPKNVHQPNETSPFHGQSEPLLAVAGEGLDNDAVYCKVSKTTTSGRQKSVPAVYSNVSEEAHQSGKSSPPSTRQLQDWLTVTGERLGNDAVYCKINKAANSGSLPSGRRAASEESRLRNHCKKNDRGKVAEDKKSTALTPKESLETNTAKQEATSEEEVYDALFYTRHNTLPERASYSHICFDRETVKQNDSPRRKSQE